MARAVSEIEREIRALEPDEQEYLLRALLEKRDGHRTPTPTKLGLRKRNDGVASSIPAALKRPAEEVLAKARAELKRR